MSNDDKSDDNDDDDDDDRSGNWWSTFRLLPAFCIRSKINSNCEFFSSINDCIFDNVIFFSFNWFDYWLYWFEILFNSFSLFFNCFDN